MITCKTCNTEREENTYFFIFGVGCAGSKSAGGVAAPKGVTRGEAGCHIVTDVLGDTPVGAAATTFLFLFTIKSVKNSGKNGRSKSTDSAVSHEGSGLTRVASVVCALRYDVSD